MAGLPAKTAAILSSAVVALGSLPLLAADPSASSDHIRIGATLPLSGSGAKVGEFYKQGYQLAFEQASKRGGLVVGGQRIPVSLVLRDDRGDPSIAVAAAQRLVEEDRVHFLLGTYSSPVTLAQSTVAETSRIPYVNGGASAPEIYQRGYRYLFGLLGPTSSVSEAVMGWVEENQQRSALPSPARVAILWERSPNGRDYRKGLSDFVEKSASRRAAFSIVFDEDFDPNRIAEIGPSLARLKAAGADVFLVDARLADSIEIHRRYLAAGLCHKVISYGSRGPEKEAREALGKENVAYLVSSAPWNSQLGAKGPTKEFIDAFHGKYGHAPGRYEALAYEAARALFAAVEQAGSLDREQVREKLASLRIESILPGGLLTFPAAYGQQARYLFVVQQNLPDGRAPIVYPRIAATKEGIAPNPRCSH